MTANSSKTHHSSCCCLRTALIIALIVFTITGAIPRYLGNLLEKTDSPREAQIIYVYGGSPVERPAAAALLYKNKYAPKVATGGDVVDNSIEALGQSVNEATLNAMSLRKYGVPQRDIIVINKGTSTYEETIELLSFMKSHHLKSAILVTSNFHTRRVRWSARKVFRDSGITITVVSATRPIVDLDSWWRSEDSLIAVTNEYIKLILYYIKY